jgi:hypothetical protein
VVKGPKGRPDTQTNWSTDCRPQEQLKLQDILRITVSCKSGIYGVESRYLAMVGEARADKEGSVPDTVNCTVRELAIEPELLVVSRLRR